MSLKQLSMRIRSTTSTAKITKAIKMVAAAKLKSAERMMLAARPFANSTRMLFDDILTPDPEAEDYTAPESRLMLALSSDKGLCGGINSKVVKEIKLDIDGSEKAGKATPEVIILGSKVRDGLQRTHGNYIKTTMDEAYGKAVTFSLASFAAEQMLATPADEYTLLGNRFKSVMTQDVEAMTMKGPECLGGSGVLDEYEFEGEKENILANFYQFHLAVQLYSGILENVTSEQASKMTAMDSATNNATDMISKLTIIYNRQRQAKVTTELTEIVAGAESV
jgi:ATP synthase F1 gamma subunit